MKIFAFDPHDYRNEYRANGFAHVPSGVTAEFLEAVSPALSVLQVGGSNTFGHPHPETLERLAAAAPGAPVVVTADRGDVTVSTDGKRAWLRTER